MPVQTSPTVDMPELKGDLAADDSAAPGADAICACADAVSTGSLQSPGDLHAGWEQPGRALVGGPWDARPPWRQLHAGRAGARRALRGQAAAANSAAARGGARAAAQGCPTARELAEVYEGAARACRELRACMKHALHHK